MKEAVINNKLSTGIDAGCWTLVHQCAVVVPDDRVLVVSDDITSGLGNRLAGVANRVTERVKHVTIPSFTMHGEEPEVTIAEQMNQANVIFAITKMSMAHSRACKNAIANGARYLSLPDYSESLLQSASLQADFQSLTRQSEELADKLSVASTITLETASGSNMRFDIRGRFGNAAPGWCNGPGTIASPPDIETNIAIVEDGSEGILVVDGSIPCAEFGLLESPLTLRVEGGRVIEITGKQSKRLEAIFDRAATPLARILAEFGIGLNPKAKLTGVMLEDEGCLGTVHIGIGANATIGGQNSVPFHLDHIIRHATVKIDGDTLLKNGQLVN